eukprot:1249724-Amphidinium_carterae.2
MAYSPTSCVASSDSETVWLGDDFPLVGPMGGRSELPRRTSSSACIRTSGPSGLSEAFCGLD